MRNTDQWMAQAREPYLKHYDEAFLKKQWADLCDVVVESVFSETSTVLISLH